MNASTSSKHSESSVSNSDAIIQGTGQSLTDSYTLVHWSASRLLHGCTRNFSMYATGISLQGVFYYKTLSSLWETLETLLSCTFSNDGCQGALYAAPSQEHRMPEVLLAARIIHTL